MRSITLRTIEIIISPAGETRVETKGFSGAACRDASRLLEESLGQKTGERLTAEFWQTGEVQEENRQQENRQQANRQQE